MGNLVTLSSTTLISPLGREDGEAYVASVAGLSDGTRLYIDRESAAVIGNPLANPVRLRRGQDGTGAEPHPNGATAWIAQPDQLYSRDPAGLPPTELLVSPWINVLTGAVWFAQGDAVGPGASTTLRRWAKQETTYTVGALGVETITQAPTAST